MIMIRRRPQRTNKRRTCASFSAAPCAFERESRSLPAKSTKCSAPCNLTLVFGNYVHDQLDGGVTGALYPDQGSAYAHWYGNVVERTHG